MPYMVAAGCLAQQAVKRVLAVQLVVAVGQDQDGRQVGDPPDEVTQRVKRRVVGPVNVLNNQNCRMLSPVQFRAQGGEHPVAVTAVCHRVAELGSYAAHQVAERAQGPRSRQIVAVADKHPALGGQVRAQSLDQAGLADPRLTNDQRNGPMPAGGRPHGTSEHRQLGLALHNPPSHTAIVKGWQSYKRAARPGSAASSGQFDMIAVAGNHPEHPLCTATTAGSSRSPAAPNGGSACVIHSLCSPVGGRPASPRKSQSKSQRGQTSGDTQRRQANVEAGQRYAPVESTPVSFTSNSMLPSW